MGGQGQTGTQPMVGLKGVACLRGDRLLFEGLSMTLRPGEAALVTGPNGVGKSSLLRIIAGLLKPAAGEVRREGGVALAAEAAGLDEGWSLGQALGFWAGIDGTPKDALGGAMATMGIDALAPVPVRMLSTGQRKRALLARTIASGAAIWLLDEPANGLDSDGLDRLGTAMARHRISGGIVVAASHQPIALPDAVGVTL